jgi:DNA polymerase-4
MAQLGIETGLDLKGQALEFLQQHFGKAGSYYYWAARGIDERPVRADRIPKSVGAENTFPADLLTHEAARDALREIVDKVWGYCERSGIRGRTVTLKVKFANFQVITVKHIIDRTDPGYLTFWAREGKKPHDATMRGIELLGKEVIPALREHQSALVTGKEVTPWPQ